MPGDYPYLIALEYADPYRAQRILDLIGNRGQLTPDDFRAIQADTLSLHARALLPLLLERADPTSEADRQALALLEAWDFDASGNSAAAAVYQAWFLRLAPALVGDELGPELLDAYRGRFSHITRFVTAALAEGGSPWCDVTTTVQVETCRERVTWTLHEAVADVTARLGSDPSRWRWDALHRAVFPHQGLDPVWLLRPLLSRSVPSAGDWSTVNVGTTSATRLYEQHSVPSYRQIVDLSPANDSRFLDAVGQSGHFLSSFYDNFLTDWREVAHRPMRMDPAAIAQGARGRLRLVPR
jgi:penicillin amidase